MKTCIRCTLAAQSFRRGLCPRCYRLHRGEYPIVGRKLSAEPRCLHCKHWAASTARGLCRRCFDNLDIREQYPHYGTRQHVGDLARFGRRGTGNGNAKSCLPDAPTSAEPGSPEKIQIMQERARRRESLFHPLDAGVARISEAA